MSATGRKKRIKKSNKTIETEREEFDFYPTPKWATVRFLEKAKNRLPIGYWVEPAAGNGALVRTVQAFGQGYENNHWHLVEIQDKFEDELSSISKSVHIGNFMKHSIPHSALNPKTNKVDVVITNPPYKEAEPMIKHARQISNAVVMLLRINFLSSEKRHSWLSGDIPDIYVLPNRPSFKGKGTDATDYCWMVWDDKSSGKIYFLDKTSRQVRYEEKRMQKCLIVKPLNEFHNDKSTKDGKTYTCKKCRNLHKATVYYPNNKERILKVKKAYDENNREK